MNREIRNTILYGIVIITGYLVGQYPRIPSFKMWIFEHVQTKHIEIIDKATAFTLLSFSIVMYFALWHNFWLKVIMVFIVCSMLNNFVDEMTNHISVFSQNEQISLLLALLTTSILIWKHRRK
jgi:hypothetical protein